MVELNTTHGRCFDIVSDEKDITLDRYKKILNEYDIGLEKIEYYSYKANDYVTLSNNPRHSGYNDNFIDKFPFANMSEHDDEWELLEFALAEYYYLNPSEQKYIEYSWHAPYADEAARAAADEAANGSGDMEDGRHWTDYVKRFDFSVISEYRNYVEELVKRAMELNIKVDLDNLEALNSTKFKESKSINESKSIKENWEDIEDWEDTDNYDFEAEYNQALKEVADQLDNYGEEEAAEYLYMNNHIYYGYKDKIAKELRIEPEYRKWTDANIKQVNESKSIKEDAFDYDENSDKDQLIWDHLSMKFADICKEILGIDSEVVPEQEWITLINTLVRINKMTNSGEYAESLTQNTLKDV